MSTVSQRHYNLSDKIYPAQQCGNKVLINIPQQAEVSAAEQIITQ